MSKRFVTIKIVDACPMQALQAELKGYRTNNIPSETAGYELTYEDGYKSWCPKDVFDENAVEVKDIDCSIYKCQDTYPDYVNRMITELYELISKMNEIFDFSNTEEFDKLDEYKQNLLRKQSRIMLGYVSILRERIIDEISIPVE